MKRKTQQEHLSRINSALFFIHSHLAEALDIQRLADHACYSLHHFQKAFKQITGESVHDYIKRSRLEWAANLLIFNPNASVLEIAHDCGFQSQASFTHAFKHRFDVTPGQWRKGGYEEQRLQRGKESKKDPDHPFPHYFNNRDRGETKSLNIKLVNRPNQRVAYLRHKGYDASIRNSWLKLTDWAQQALPDWQQKTMIALLHSNPNIIPFNECRYVVCLTIPEDCYPSQGVGLMIIPKGLYASCHVTGRFGDLLPVLDFVYEEWIPKQNLTAVNIPAHTVFQQNHLLNESGQFELDLYVPVKAL